MGPAFSSLRELQAIFGSGPIGTLAACCALAVLVLFWLLIRSQKAHLQTALMLAPIASKMQATVEANSRLLTEAVKALEDATLLMQAAQAKRPRAPRVPAEIKPPLTAVGG